MDTFPDSVQRVPKNMNNKGFEALVDFFEGLALEVVISSFCFLLLLSVAQSRKSKPKYESNINSIQHLHFRFRIHLSIARFILIFEFLTCYLR